MKRKRARMDNHEDRAPGPLPRTLLVVDAVIDPAVETEWNDWYDTKHVPEILACPHFKTAARYVSDDNGLRKYLTIYALSSEEAVRTPQFAQARGWAQFKEKVRASTRLYTRLGNSR